MGKHRGSGDWLVLEEMLERGDPAFVDALRSFDDAETLASFGARWYADKRPASRRLLLDYLDRPLNAFRHEPLVKRLFKLAEAAGDDEAMARFLVLFDRSIRREESRRARFESRTCATQAEAQALVARWKSLEFDDVSSWQDAKSRVHVMGHWSEPIIRAPLGTAMPRDDRKYRNPRTGEQISGIGTRLGAWLRKSLGGAPVPARARKRIDRLRLFSMATRQYLRRRAWRYFRRLGVSNPKRYVAAISRALVRYTDEDVANGLALIDNWGLMHVLFRRSPVLVAQPAGWTPAAGRVLNELVPAPIYERLWEQSPRAVVDVLIGASSRPVRQWAILMVRRQEAARAAIRIDEVLRLLSHQDPDVVAFAAELVREAKGLEALGVERWLELLETIRPEALEVVVDLMRRHVDCEQLSLDQVVGLSGSRPLPVARLGLEWLRTRVPRDPAEVRALLSLTEAECEPLRAEIVRLVRQQLTAKSHFESSWLLEFVDSGHADVRAQGTAWFRAEPRARDDVTILRCLLESPHDDVRLFVISELESRVAGRDIDRIASLGASDSEALRLLCASVLLNIHRGSRAKPRVASQVAGWIERRPEDCESLLPLLAAALRSARGPERRAGLAAVAELVARRPQTVSVVNATIPELRLR
jgi:hypothetical protein